MKVSNLVAWRRAACAALLAVTAIISPTAAVESPAAGWTNALKPSGTAGAALPLSANGMTEYVILLPEEFKPVDKKAADDLSEWLNRITSANFELVKEEPGSTLPEKFISIGNTKAFADSGAPAIDLGADGYLIHQQGQNLYLVGGHDRGPINAVWALLEEDLGCRWYAHHAKVVTRDPDLSAAIVSRHYVPTLKYRDPYYFDAFNVVPNWCLANRINGQNSNILAEHGNYPHYPPGYFAHTHPRFVPRDEYFDTHPEYFALMNGERNRMQLCLTNEDVYNLSLEAIRKVLQERPDATLMDISPEDGGGHCECTNCQAVDNANGATPAGSQLVFVNRLAEALEEEFPNVKFSTLAYLDTIDAPTPVRPRSNVVIQLCNNLHSWAYPLADFTVHNQWPRSQRWLKALNDWGQVADQIHIWDYTVNYGHYLAPFPNMHLIAPSIQYYIEHNAVGVMFQGAYQCHGGERMTMRIWVMAKLLWDPSLDTDALIRDFNYGYYGAAGPMVDAYDTLLAKVGEPHQTTLDPVWGIQFKMDAPFLSIQFIDASSELFAEAEKAVKDDAELLRRVQLAKLPILYVKCVRGEELCGDQYAEIIDEFESIATENEVHYLSETRHPNLNEKIEFWRGIAAATSDKISFQELSNEWKFQVDPNEIGIEQQWSSHLFDDSAWPVLRSDLGSGWEKQGFPTYFGYAWYRQTLVPPSADAYSGKQLLLFGAIDEESEVYINGVKVFDNTTAGTGLSAHILWERPFAFDATPFFRPGEENTIAVRVFNQLGMGGIYKPAYFVWTMQGTSATVLHELIQQRNTKQNAHVEAVD